MYPQFPDVGFLKLARMSTAEQVTEKNATSLGCDFSPTISSLWFFPPRHPLHAVPHCSPPMARSPEALYRILPRHLSDLVCSVRVRTVRQRISEEDISAFLASMTASMRVAWSAFGRLRIRFA